jgi:hypothetical protein
MRAFAPESSSAGDRHCGLRSHGPPMGRREQIDLGPSNRMPWPISFGPPQRAVGPLAGYRSCSGSSSQLAQT